MLPRPSPATRAAHPQNGASSATSHQLGPNISAIAALARPSFSGLFNQGRSCWLRFAPQQYTLDCSAILTRRLLWPPEDHQWYSFIGGGCNDLPSLSCGLIHLRLKGRQARTLAVEPSAYRLVFPGVDRRLGRTSHQGEGDRCEDSSRCFHRNRRDALEWDCGRTSASATAGIRSVLEPSAQAPFAGRKGWATSHNREVRLSGVTPICLRMARRVPRSSCRWVGTTVCAYGSSRRMMMWLPCWRRTENPSFSSARTNSGPDT